MELLSVRDLSYSNGSRTIIEKASFRVLGEKKYALIGPNGAGKTTLIRLLTGELESDKGTFQRKEKLRVSLVPQNQVPADPSTSIRDFMLEPVLPAKRKLESLELKLASAGNEEMSRLLSEYQKAQDNYEAVGGYSAEERSLNLLEKLGLDNDPEQPAGTLSGGERSLLFFARALTADPELLILDEPGNHLDYLGLAWLESFLRSFKGAVIIVSHNRYMIDAVCDEIWHLQNARLTEFSGNYSSFRTSMLRDLVIQQSDYSTAVQELATLEKRIKQIQSITTNSYNPPKTLLVELGALKGKSDRIRRNMPEKPQIEKGKIGWKLDRSNNRSDIALEIHNLYLGFDDKALIEKSGFTLHCGEKAALVGVNGSGKTTLLKAVLSEGNWESETIRTGPSQKIGYVSQTPIFSETAETIEQEVRSWAPMGKDDAFAIISRFLFTYRDMDKPLSVLSGGEKSRLQLARVMYERADFLILDEPTNHMDIPSREVIEEVLEGFNGTILVVSHDRFFLDRIAGRVIEISEKRLVCHEGNFSGFFRSRYPVLPKLSGSVDRRVKEKTDLRQSASSDEAKRIEKRIEAAEAEKERLSRELEAALNKNDHIRGRQTANRLDILERDLGRLYSDWENSF